MTKENIRHLYTYLYSALFFTIPFTEVFQAIPNILLGLLMLFFVFTVTRKDWNKINRIYICLYTTIILVVTTGLVIHERTEDFSFLTKLLIVLVIVLLSIPIRDYKKPIYGFLSGSLLLLVISSINLSIHYIKYQSIKMDVGQKINELLIGERPFLGFIYLTSFILCIFLANKTSKNLHKRILFAASILFAGFILFISARLSILSLVLIILSFIFFTAHKKRAILLAAVTLTGIVLLVSVNPSFIKRFTAGFDQNEISLQKLIVLEPRSHIWECAFVIGDTQSLPLLGYGFRNTVDKLSECYSTRNKFLNEEHRLYFINSRFNTHNQFLNFYLSCGIPALFLFILFFIFLLKDSLNYTSFALILGLLLFCCFENVLSRQIGATLFGVIIALFVLLENHYKSQNINN